MPRYLLIFLVAVAVFNLAYGAYYIRYAEVLASRHRERFRPGWGWPRKAVGPSGHRIIGSFIIAYSLLFLVLLFADVVRRGVH